MTFKVLVGRMKSALCAQYYRDKQRHWPVEFDRQVPELALHLLLDNAEPELVELDHLVVCACLDLSDLLVLVDFVRKKRLPVEAFVVSGIGLTHYSADILGRWLVTMRKRSGNRHLVVSTRSCSPSFRQRLLHSVSRFGGHVLTHK